MARKLNFYGPEDKETSPTLLSFSFLTQQLVTCPNPPPPLFCHDLSSPSIDQGRNSLKIDL